MLWVMAVILGSCLAVAGVGAGLYVARSYVPFGQLCGCGCCGRLRASTACTRCISCWKRSRASTEDCILHGKCCCSLEACQEQLLQCICLRKSCSKLKAFTISKCCPNKENEQPSTFPCCAGLSWCGKDSKSSKVRLQMILNSVK